MLVWLRRFENCTVQNSLSENEGCLLNWEDHMGGGGVSGWIFFEGNFLEGNIFEKILSES